MEQEREESNLPVQASGTELVKKQSEEIADRIVAETDPTELKRLTDLFNLAQQKKNILRVLKYNGLLDSIGDQIQKRIEQKPDEFSNADLLSYMQAIHTAIDKSKINVDAVAGASPITIVDPVVNINAQDSLSRESREKVTDIVRAILQGALTGDVPPPIVVDQDAANQSDKEQGEE